MDQLYNMTRHIKYGSWLQQFDISSADWWMWYFDWYYNMTRPIKIQHKAPTMWVIISGLSNMTFWSMIQHDIAYQNTALEFNNVNFNWQTVKRDLWIKNTSRQGKSKCDISSADCQMWPLDPYYKMTRHIKILHGNQAMWFLIREMWQVTRHIRILHRALTMWLSSAHCNVWPLAKRRKAAVFC